MSNMSNPATGAPYPPTTAAVGGMPTVGVDVPISSVLLVLFMIGAAGHMTIFQINRRHGHKFLMSALIFGFCMARIVTMVLRIAWATRPHNVRLGIAAQIFVSAGVLILFIINLIFTQRIVRAMHPNFGWHVAFSTFFKVLYALVLAMLAMVITATVQSFYTLNPHIKKIDLDLQRTASTYLMTISFLPIPMVGIGLLLPRKAKVEKFGVGRWRTKITLLLLSATLLCLGASFRTGTLYRNPKPRSSPAWYHAKWCFYFFNFVVEIIVVYLYLVLRIDKRFHIPDGSKGAGAYTSDQNQESADSNAAGPRHSFVSGHRILSEEEVFDNESPVESPIDAEKMGRMSTNLRV